MMMMMMMMMTTTMTASNGRRINVKCLCYELCQRLSYHICEEHICLHPRIRTNPIIHSPDSQYCVYNEISERVCNMKHVRGCIQKFPD